jgi:aspartyl-tRNA synthetase
MIAGVDRYFQLARCFRDEDLRADRQPEFTQLDVEMSFVTRDELFEIGEGAMKHIFREALGVEVQTPFVRFTYAEAMARFGVDKPDLRYGCEIKDFGAAVEGCEFRVFADALSAGGKVLGIFIPGAKTSRKDEDELNAFVKSKGAAGVGVLTVHSAELSGGLKKYFDAARVEAMYAAAGETGDGAFLILAGEAAKLLPILGALRTHAAARFNVPKAKGLHFCWIVDFPLYELNPDTGELDPKHHAFTSPVTEDIPMMDSDPLAVRADSYDMVLNGEEMGSGSLRVFDPALQRKILARMGMPDDVISERFGFLLKAYEYGGPPHRGFAVGLDRLVGIMVGVEGIRDVIAFPKTTSGQCPLTGAPSGVSPEQLDELGIALKPGLE